MEKAKEHDLIIIHESEITRDSPIGHSNVIFITDANKLMGEDAVISFVEAKKQVAFVIWNHPVWYAQSPTGNLVLSDF